jgi:hypothetical protein
MPYTVPEFTAISTCYKPPSVNPPSVKLQGMGGDALMSFRRVPPAHGRWLYGGNSRTPSNQPDHFASSQESFLRVRR